MRTPQYNNFSYNDVHQSPPSFDKFGPIQQKYGPPPATKEGKIKLKLSLIMYKLYNINYEIKDCIPGIPLY